MSHEVAETPSAPLGSYPRERVDSPTVTLFRCLEAAFGEGGRWADLPAAKNILHQLLVSAAFLTEADPMTIGAQDIDAAEGRRLIGLDVERLGSALDVGTAECFALLAHCVMARPNSGKRQLAKRELEAAILVAAGGGGKHRSEHQPTLKDEGGAVFVEVATNYVVRVSRDEAEAYQPSLPETVDEVLREVATEAAYKFYT